MSSGGLAIVGGVAIEGGTIAVDGVIMEIGAKQIGNIGSNLQNNKAKLEQAKKERCEKSSGKAKDDIEPKVDMPDEKVEWSNYGYKHAPQKNMSWKDITDSTKNGPAKYKPEIDIESTEKMVWEKGTSVTNGKTWKVKEFDDVIGASDGVETKYMRVEMSGGTIHGHPITKSEYLKLLK